MLLWRQRVSRRRNLTIAITPSAKLLKPFYWTAAIIAGLILFYSNNSGNNVYPLLIVPAVLFSGRSRGMSSCDIRN